MFVRPLSRSQLAPVHVGGSSPGQGGSLLSSPPPLPPLPSARPISLDQPRPTSERHGNVYLGAPISHHSSSGASGSGGTSGGSSVSHHVGGSGSGKSVRLDSKITAAEQVRLPTNSRTKKGHSDTSSHVSSVVTSQPTKRNLLKDESSSSSESGKVKLAESSITCPYCRRCRCEACATPRPLPSRWICSKSIHCGPEPFLDYVTCLCCVKAVFYHCGKNHEPDGGVLCADKPCSCAPHRKFWRWGCMAAMSVVLPCLCLYWPCRGCIGLAEKAYQKYHNNGCTCHRSSPTFGSSAAPSSREAAAGLTCLKMRTITALPVVTVILRW
ncbi:Protein sprouty [Orchesella cincta]|uniref:Protein sprouty n=1 Tax=Orchesella cincta TaxID=48709 RepID=A0A1D2NF82_ORCCI|nr:Protein sprouty [Orchesella cincta]